MEKLVLTKQDGDKEEVEIIATFNIEENDDVNYIIYKNDVSYYAAKYIEKDNNIKLMHNLSDGEKESIIKIFDEIKNGGML